MRKDGVNKLFLHFHSTWDWALFMWLLMRQCYGIFSEQSIIVPTRWQFCLLKCLEVMKSDKRAQLHMSCLHWQDVFWRGHLRKVPGWVPWTRSDPYDERKINLLIVVSLNDQFSKGTSPFFFLLWVYIFKNSNGIMTEL